MSLFVLSHSISVVFVGSANKRWEPRGHRWFFGGWHPYNAQIIHQNQMPLLPEKVGNCEMLCTSLPTKIPCGLWHREKVPKWIRTPAHTVHTVMSTFKSNQTRTNMQPMPNVVSAVSLRTTSVVRLTYPEPAAAASTTTIRNPIQSQCHQLKHEWNAFQTKMKIQSVSFISVCFYCNFCVVVQII